MSSKSKSGDAGSKTRRGFVSRLFHRRSDDTDKKTPLVISPIPPDTAKTTAETVQPSPEVNAISEPETPSKAEIGPDPSPVVQARSGPSKRSRREQAEKRLEDAAGALSKSMTKSSAQVPDAIGLQHLSNIKDVEGTAKQLESTIDGIIDAREVKVNVDSRRVWKDCIKNWFKAVYPYLNVGLTEVEVNLIHSLYSWFRVLSPLHMDTLSARCFICYRFIPSYRRLILARL